MSHVRRILIIFAVLILVAAGACAVYLTTDKSGKDALRFSMVDTTGPRELIPGLSGPCSVESIAVENTGSQPIHLISMWVTEAAPGVADVNVTLAPASPAHPTAAGSSSSTGPASVLIPPRGTVYATSAVPLTAGAPRQLRMNLLWQPRTQYLVGRALEWLHARSPRTVQPHIPSLSASIDNADIE
jgi:hypothetical protein